MDTNLSLFLCDKKMKLHILIPFILAAVFVADVCLRFCSMDNLSFTPTYALTRNRPPYSTFETGRHLKLDDCYGGMALRIPKLRQYRSESLTTDSLGFRNVEPQVKSPQVLLVGSSFLESYGMSDEQALSTVLSQDHNLSVYNASQLYLMEPRDIGILLPLFQHTAQSIIALADKLEMKEGVVIIDHPWGLKMPVYSQDEINSPANRARVWLADTAYKMNLEKQLGYLEGCIKISYLGRWAQIQFDRLSTAIDLPNRFEQLVDVKVLPKGEKCIVFSSGKWNWTRIHDDSGTCNYLSDLSKRLKQRNLTLLVALAPSMQFVYNPYFKDFDRNVYQPYPTYFSSLAEHLKEKNVEVVDFTDTFVQAAPEAYSNGNLLFLPDDGHWSYLGTKLAAKEIAGAVHKLNQKQTER